MHPHGQHGTALAWRAGDAHVTRTPLYGHADASTAYVVADYPYGRTVRTQIRYWLERKPKLGWRLVSQTMNPKTGRWNAPKPSTYSAWGGAMFLDHVGHVQWTGLGPYSSAEDVRAFVRDFPGAHLETIRSVVERKVAYYTKVVGGEVRWTVNGKPLERTAHDVVRDAEELGQWKHALIDLQEK